MSDTTPERWRTGRSVGRTIYRMVGEVASKNDVLIGVMDTRELAIRIVAAVNAANAAAAKWETDRRAALDAPSAPESPTDAPTAPTRPGDTHQPHNGQETTP